MGKSLRPRLVPLYEQLANLIEGEIRSGRLRPGQKLHSTREAAEAFQVSEVTARKGVRLLVRRGLVRTVAGSGVFVAERPTQVETGAGAYPLVAFIKVRPHIAPVFAYEIDLIQQALAQAGCFMLYAVAETEADVPRVLERLVSAKAARCILHFPPHAIEYDRTPYRTEIRRAGVPALVIESPSEADSYVMADTERGAAEVADYLYGLGHRRLCLATAFPRKVAGVRKAAERWAEPVDLHVLDGVDGSDAPGLGLAQRVLALEPRPTAVMAGNDRAAVTLIGALQRHGVRVPDGISVTTFDDHPVLARESPVPLTALAHPVHAVAREVAAWVQTQVRDARGAQRRFRRCIPGSLVIRESTAAPR